MWQQIYVSTTTYVYTIGPQDYVTSNRRSIGKGYLTFLGVHPHDPAGGVQPRRATNAILTGGYFLQLLVQVNPVAQMPRVLPLRVHAPQIHVFDLVAFLGALLHVLHQRGAEVLCKDAPFSQQSIGIWRQVYCGAGLIGES